METTQNEILDKMSSPDNADNLVELQLNLARGMEEIKLLASNPTKPLQLYPQNALLVRQQPAHYFPLPVYKKVFRTEKKRSLHCLEC